MKYKASAYRRGDSYKPAELVRSWSCPNCSYRPENCICEGIYKVISGNNNVSITWYLGSFNAVITDRDASLVSEFQREFIESWPNTNLRFERINMTPEELRHDAMEEEKFEFLKEREEMRKPSEYPFPCGGCGLELVPEEDVLGPKCQLEAFELFGIECTSCHKEIDKGPVFNRHGFEGSGKLLQVCRECRDKGI